MGAVVVMEATNSRIMTGLRKVGKLSSDVSKNSYSLGRSWPTPSSSAKII